MSEIPTSEIQTSESPAPKSRSSVRRERAFRVKLRGSILALLRLPNKREVRARVHQISITGGLMNLETPLDEKLQIELIFQLGKVTIREKAEMLFPMWATQGWLQPFRFIEVTEANKAILEANLHTFVQSAQSTPQAAETPALAKAAEAS
ncbi:MAG TPA: hypothetical protein VGG14_17785 [Candidatus Sulfotelmatobacter sp.]|jgi:hypothetical protein